MVWTPRVTVAAIVPREDRFLLVEEQTAHGIRINQPAGHLDEGESLLQAVVRETLEETAWDVAPQALIGVYRWRIGPNGLTYLRFCFLAAAIAEDPARTLDSGILQALWLTREDLAATPERLRSPLVLRGIDDYLAGHRYPLALLHDFGG
jgi:8-oxo-dGTP pyrophosphatase MutT (NUDIX family)